MLQVLFDKFVKFSSNYMFSRKKIHQFNTLPQKSGLCLLFCAMMVVFKKLGLYEGLYLLSAQCFIAEIPMPKLLSFFRSFLLYEFFRDDISWHLNRSIPQADCPGFRTGNSTLTKFEKKRTFESNFYRMEFLANNSIFAQKTGTDLQPTFVFCFSPRLLFCAMMT